jgi:hypothetical protein
VDGELFDPGLLDEEDPFEVDSQVAHLFKHPYLGIDDIDDVWASDPLFYPAKPPAHWLMVAEVAGRVLMVPLAPAQRRPAPVSANRLLRSLASACRPVQEGPQMNTPMTPDEEYAFYARPENQEPQGPARRRDGSRLSAPVPVRFPPELLDQARRAADAVDRSLSSWIRLAVEHELRRDARPV